MRNAQIAAVTANSAGRRWGERGRPPVSRASIYRLCLMAGDAVMACTEMQQMRRAGSGCDVVNHVIARRQVNEREIAQLLDEHLLLLGARDRAFRRIKP